MRRARRWEVSLCGFRSYYLGTDRARVAGVDPHTCDGDMVRGCGRWVDIAALALTEIIASSLEFSAAPQCPLLAQSGQHNTSINVCFWGNSGRRSHHNVGSWSKADMSSVNKHGVVEGIHRTRSLSVGDDRMTDGLLRRLPTELIAAILVKFWDAAVLAAVQSPTLPLVKCGGSWSEGRSVVEYALHGARKNDSIPDARVCDHACGHGRLWDLRAGLGPILGRFHLRRLGWLGLGWSPVGRLGWPLSLGSLLPATARPRFFQSLLW